MPASFDDYGKQSKHGLMVVWAIHNRTKLTAAGFEFGIVTVDANSFNYVLKFIADQSVHPMDSFPQSVPGFAAIVQHLVFEFRFAPSCFRTAV